MFGEGSIAWAKSIENPGSLTSAEIKVVDGWLHNQVLQWERTKLLQEERLLSAAEAEQKIRKGVAFYFGNRFGRRGLTWIDSTMARNASLNSALSRSGK